MSLGGTSGTQYSYTRNKNDQINVFVAPYQREDRLITADDTPTSRWMTSIDFIEPFS